MKKHFFFSILITLQGTTLVALSPYPADISYLVADIKYSKEHGLKICEVQHGSLSALEGDCYLSGGDGTIAPMIADFFDNLPLKKWAAGVIYPPLQRSLAAKGWNIVSSLQVLLKDPTFLSCAQLSPVDPWCMNSYAGIVYADYDVVRTIDFYRKAYPGILFVNAATFPYWRDKYAMNILFEGNDELKQYKAEWRLYPKKYDALLAKRIQKDLSAQRYVIKPRTECLANGIIVVESGELDTVLHMILEPRSVLEKHPDRKYAYWWKNKDNTFIIEKYYKSDYVRFSRHHYDATMRVAFIMYYDEGKITYHFLGAFWKLPVKGLEEEGTLNEKRISCCKTPFYKAVDQELLKEVNTHMERGMFLLYENMIHGKKD